MENSKAKTAKKSADDDLGLVKDKAPAKPKASTPTVQKTVASAKPKQSDDELKAKLLAGTSGLPNQATSSTGGRMSTDEILHTYFRPTDLVKLHNPFDFDTGWVYSDMEDITVENPDAITRRIYGIGEGYQKVRILRAGATLVVPGWEAYVGLTRFFKEWAQKHGTPRDINNMDLFRRFVGQVFAGTFDPNAQNSAKSDASVELGKDLGLAGGNA